MLKGSVYKRQRKERLSAIYMRERTQPDTLLMDVRAFTRSTLWVIICSMTVHHALCMWLCRHARDRERAMAARTALSDLCVRRCSPACSACSA